MFTIIFTPQAFSSDSAKNGYATIGDKLWTVCIALALDAIYLLPAILYITNPKF